MEQETGATPPLSCAAGLAKFDCQTEATAIRMHLTNAFKVHTVQGAYHAKHDGAVSGGEAVQVWVASIRGGLTTVAVLLLLLLCARLSQESDSV